MPDYTIEEWTPDGKDLVEVLATVTNVRIAKAAFIAAWPERPKALLLLRKGALVIGRREPLGLVGKEPETLPGLDIEVRGEVK